MKKWFSLSLVLTILLAGCVDQGPTIAGCNVNGIVVLDYNVLNLEEIRPGDITSIFFWLANQGDYDAEDVRVKFFDTQGFEVIDMKGCVERSGNECKLGNIEAGFECQGDMKEVSVDLKAPETKGTRTVSFSVKYGYSGSSSLIFSIWKKGTKQWGKKEFSQTVGPISVDIDPGFLLRRIVEGRTETVTEWVEEGQKFTLKINVKNDGSLGSGFEHPDITILKDDFKIRFKNVHPDPDGKCNFTSKGDYYVLKNDITVPTKEPLNCNMIADEVDEEWESGKITVDYSYTYEFIGKQELEVKK